MRMKNLIKNTASVLTAKILNSIFSLATFMLVARALPLTDVGAYTLILSVAAIVTVLSNCGTNEFLFRRGAYARNKLQIMLRTANMSRLFLGLLAGAVATALLLATHHDITRGAAIPIGFAAAIIDAQTIAYIMAFRAQGDMLFETKLYLWRGAARLALIALCIQLSPDLLSVLLAILATNIGGLLYARYTNRRNHPPLASRFSLRYTCLFIRQASPYLLMGIIATIGTQADVIMLGFIRNTHEVGIYSIAAQIYTTLVFLPVSLNIAIQPTFVQYYKNSIDIWLGRTRKTFLFLLVPSILLCVALIMPTPYLLPLLFGDKYEASIAVTIVLICAFGFRTLWVSTIHTALISANKIHMLNKITSASLILHVILNFMLIYPLGAIGAAYATLATEAALAIAGSAMIFSGKSRAIFS